MLSAMAILHVMTNDDNASINDDNALGYGNVVNVLCSRVGFWRWERGLGFGIKMVFRDRFPGPKPSLIHRGLEAKN